MLYFPLVFHLFSVSFSICGASNPFQVETYHGMVEGRVWTRLTVQAFAVTNCRGHGPGIKQQPLLPTTRNSGQVPPDPSSFSGGPFLLIRDVG